MVSEDGDPPETVRRRTALLPAVVAFVVVAAVFATSGIIRGTYPFGSLSRSTNDLGTQYIPFFAHLWDVLHGQAQGDLLYNWQSAFGVGFLADLGVDLGSPLSLLVGLFPRDQIDLAVYVITTLKLSLAAAAMAALLMKMRPGPRWVAAMLGVSYGVCGWALDDGSYVPMWLDGLIALPMFFMVAEWSLRRTNRLLSVLVVAVFWLSNFYTAYMATIAGGIYLLARLLTSDLKWSLRLRAIVRHGISFVLGMALVAPILLPIITTNRAATPSPSGIFHASPLDLFLSRLLPLTEGVGRTASLYVGTVALLLALTLPFNKFVPWLTKTVWVITTVLIALSIRWAPTQKFWHAFDTPNGSQYREAFVLCGVIVVVAWASVAHRLPGPLALVGGGALLVLIAVLSNGSPLLSDHSMFVLIVSGAVTLVAFGTIWTLRRFPKTRRIKWPVAAAFAVLLVVVAVETTWTAVITDQYRSKVLGASAAPWDDKQTARFDALREAGGWPKYRTEPGTSITPNDPILLGGQGAGLYSSLLPHTINETLTGLGFGWSGYGRASRTLDNPVTDAIFSVGARMRLVGDGEPQITKYEAPPLVTVRRRLGAPVAADFNAPNAYATQERLLGSKVYEVPEYKGTRFETGDVKLVATCKPGSSAYLFMPRVGGRARLAGGRWWDLSATRRPGINTSSAMIGLGTVPKTGVVLIELNFGEDPQGIPPKNAIGCLDQRALATTIRRLRDSGATDVEASGHAIHATLRPGSKGYAIVAVPKIDGWLCSTGEGSVGGGKAQVPRDYGGLIAIPLTGTADRIDCTFVPPGLRRGLAIGAAAAVLTLGIALIGAFRRRRRAAS
ncbi:YfhO family protein [Kribbella kalugense]|uniref:Membrane protein YfhO n=1 Tax=Kribbella kalugense TaxID=2512221 RepID=A0A4R7ZQV8_9ACTN|nr:YfhO family protein [Kribbella kalugense]TDW19191.1 membrane protein YfhO [Kribbella kalugense]